MISEHAMEKEGLDDAIESAGPAGDALVQSLSAAAKRVDPVPAPVVAAAKQAFTESASDAATSDETPSEGADAATPIRG
jgi:hypothetical protein